jgi:hypothetical protein
VARAGGVGVAQGTALEAPPTAHPREEKRIMVRILNKTEAEAIKKQTREAIVSRI